MKPPGEGVYLLVGCVDGYQVYHGSREVFACHSQEPLALMCLLPALSGSMPRNMAVVYRGSPTVIRFIDLTSSETYHMIRVGVPLIGLKANRSCIAVQMEGKVGFYDIQTLQETFLVETMENGVSHPVLALGDRWVAYNLPPQMSSPGPQTTLTVWNSITSLGQDAIDNIVMAVSKRGDTSLVSSSEIVSSPKIASVPKNARNGIVAIQDVVTQRVLGCVEDKETNRPIDWLEWSPCGTVLVTASSNGHYCKVYKTAAGGRCIEFQVIHSLNRGLTPAVITSIAVSPSLDRVAISSAKGTVHMFNIACRENSNVSASDRLKSPCENSDLQPKVIFDTNGDIIVFSNSIACVQRFKAPIDLSAVPSECLSLRGEEEISLQMPDAPRGSSRPPILETCKPVLFWQSPVIIQSMKSETGGPRVDTELLLSSLHNDIQPKLATEEYLPTTRDGFVQIMPS
jgi:hypothetical protein